MIKRLLVAAVCLAACVLGRSGFAQTTSVSVPYSANSNISIGWTAGPVYEGDIRTYGSSPVCSYLSVYPGANNDTPSASDSKWQLLGCGPFTLTTSGTSGLATYSGGVLNIPQYSGGTTFNGGTVSNGITAPFFQVSGTSGQAGAFTFGGGSAPGTQSNSVIIAGPSTAPTPYVMVLPSGTPNGNVLTCAAPSGGVSTCTWSTSGGSGLGGGIVAGNTSSGTSYNGIGLTGSNTDGSRLGIAGESNTSVNLGNLYLDALSGYSFIFRIGNNPTVQVGGTQSSGGSAASTTYSDITFNQSHVDGSRVGIVAANSSSTDPAMYVDVPSGGFFQFRVAGSPLLQIETGSAPTGACSPNGFFALSKTDGHMSWCSSGTWTQRF